MFDAAISYAVAQGTGLGTIPEVADEAGIFTTLLAAVGKAGLVDTLNSEGPFTVFAPTDDAFAKLLDKLGVSPGDLLESPDLKDILLYHVIVGEALDSGKVLAADTLTMANGDTTMISLRNGKPFINDSEIVLPDVAASNGVIHVIDTVLLPPADELGTIPEVADEAGIFTTLLAAVGKAGLADTLNSEGPFTVFAPTDDAFAKLLNDLGVRPGDLLESPDLKDILLYHVVVGEALDSADVLAVETLTMANGDDTAISLRDGKPFINDSEIVLPDVAASNGVIHVIDTVLIPPADDPRDDSSR